MLLNFDEMTPVPMEHFKGGVGTLQARPYDDGNCKVLQMTLPQGTSIGLHTHEGSCEMIFVLSGEGIHSDRENAFRSRRTGLAQKRKLRRREICRPGKGKSLFRGL